MQNLMLFLP